MKRKFFDWNRPFLPAVAKFVVEEAIQRPDAGQSVDLSRYIYVLSGNRALRTFEAYVQFEINAAVNSGRIKPGWTPPEYVALGAAPERFYTPKKRVADNLTRLYCMRRAVEDFFADKRVKRVLLRNGPAGFGAKLEIADMFLKLKDELDSERSSCRTVAEKCQEAGQPDEAKRWLELDALYGEYRKKLEDNNLTELNEARASAIQSGEIRESFQTGAECAAIRVLGAADLNRLQKDVFAALGESVEFWVFAPEEKEELFDDFGCVAPEKWERYEIPLADEQLFQVDSPPEQGEAAAYLTRELSKRYDQDGWSYEPIKPTSLTVGVPDPEVAPFVAQHMEALGYGAILAEGVPFPQNRVYQLLENVAEFVESRSFSSFEELLRRPDLERYIRSQWNAEPYTTDEARDLQKERDAQNAPYRRPEEASEAFDDVGAEDEETTDATGNEPILDADITNVGAGDWIAEIDEYRSRFLPTRVDGVWRVYLDPDNEKRNRFFVNLRKAYRILNKAFSPFWAADPKDPGVFQRTAPESAGPAFEGDEEAKRQRDKILSGKYAFIREGFLETRQWSTRERSLPLCDWAAILSHFLCEIYDVKEFPNDRATQTQIDGFFKGFNKTLDAIYAVPRELADSIKGSNAIRVALKELASSRVEPTPGSNLVEMQGALDLLFDDAPNLILTGFNEGTLPSNRGGDLFLPNEMREKVGLSDSKRVYARDAYLVTAVANSRRNLFALFGKHSLQGDPKLPSRFIFSTDRATIAQRVVKFFDPKTPSALDALKARQLDADGREREFPIAPQKKDAQTKGFKRPTLDLKRQSERKSRPEFRLMNVTDFEFFLTRGPYRFLLKNAYGLYPAPDPKTNELDAAKFGTVIHDLLRAFGKDPNIRDSRSPEAIGGWLSARLNEYAKSFVNDHTSPFVKIQIEQIRERLWGFARWQAEWRKTGAKIVAVECGPEDGWIDFPIGDGEPSVSIVGRIDRVDFNSEKNRLYVFDYKTFDSFEQGKPSKEGGSLGYPGLEKTDELYKVDVDGQTKTLYSAYPGNTIDKKHRNRKRGEDAYVWTNLQMPLYRRIIWKIREEKPELFGGNTEPGAEEKAKRNISFAYIVIPKSGDVQALGAPWGEDAFLDAEETARNVVRAIRRMWNRTVKFRDPIPELGDAALDDAKFPFGDDYEPITLSYLADQ